MIQSDVEKLPFYLLINIDRRNNFEGVYAWFVDEQTDRADRNQIRGYIIEAVYSYLLSQRREITENLGWDEPNQDIDDLLLRGFLPADIIEQLK